MLIKSGKSCTFEGESAKTMKKLIELIKTYKLEILIFLTVIFFFRSCSNSTKVGKLEKIQKQNYK